MQCRHYVLVLIPDVEHGRLGSSRQSPNANVSKITTFSRVNEGANLTSHDTGEACVCDGESEHTTGKCLHGWETGGHKTQNAHSNENLNNYSGAQSALLYLVLKNRVSKSYPRFMPAMGGGEQRSVATRFAGQTAELLGSVNLRDESQRA